MSLIASWLSRLEPVHIAGTQEEREAIYRFRYEVYVEELGKKMPDADHENRWLRAEKDEAADATLLYTGSVDGVTSTVRLRCWEPGEAPADDIHEYSIDMWPGVEKLRTAELGRLMVRPSVRGKMLLPSLMRAGFEHLAGVARTDLAFMICVPGLVRYYRALGARPFGGRIFQDPTGMSVPLALIMSDHRHLSRCGSIAAPISKRHYAKGDNPVLDLKPYRHMIEGERLSVEFDRSRVWEEVHELVEKESGQSAVFDGLSEDAVKKLLDSGFVLGLGANEGIVRQGLVDRELYIVLEGMFAVHSGDHQIALLGPGDVFGEMAFFSSHGRRTADVKSLSAGRLLVLRRRFLREFTKKDPEAGFQVLLNLSKVMADRCATQLASDEDDSEG